MGLHAGLQHSAGSFGCRKITARAAGGYRKSLGSSFLQCLSSHLLFKDSCKEQLRRLLSKERAFSCGCLDTDHVLAHLFSRSYNCRCSLWGKLSVVIAPEASAELWQLICLRACSALPAAVCFWSPLSFLALVQLSAHGSTGPSSPESPGFKQRHWVLESSQVGISSPAWVEFIATREGSRASKGGTVLSPLAAEGSWVASEGNFGLLVVVLLSNLRWAV